MVCVGGLKDGDATVASLESTCNNSMLLLQSQDVYKTKCTIAFSRLRVEDATVKLLVPANPQVHNRHTLTSIFNRFVPPLLYKASYPIL